MATTDSDPRTTPDRYGRVCTCKDGPTKKPQYPYWLHYDNDCAVMQMPTESERRHAKECINNPSSGWGRYVAPCTRPANGADGLCGLCRGAIARGKARTAARR